MADKKFKSKLGLGDYDMKDPEKKDPNATAIQNRQDALGFLSGFDASSGAMLATGLGKLGQPMGGNTKQQALDTSGSSEHYFKGK